MSALESMLKMMLANFPSTWNVVISTIVFVLAIWYLQKWLNKSDQPKSAARGIAVFVLASVLSWGSGVLIDWALVKIDGPQPKSYLQKMLEKMIEDAGINLEN
jgi:membrane protein implicated in regulation of membrane protease activity